LVIALRFIKLRQIVRGQSTAKFGQFKSLSSWPNDSNVISTPKR